MNYLAQAKIDTPVYELPGNMGNKLNTIKAGEQFKIINNKRNGLKTYYEINSGGYVISSDTIILRDDDYFYNYYSSKKLINRSFKSNTLYRGLSSVLGETNDITTNYSWLLSVTENDFNYILFKNNVLAIETSFNKMDSHIIPSSLKSEIEGLKKIMNSINDINNIRTKTKLSLINRLYVLKSHIENFIDYRNINSSNNGANDLASNINSVNNFFGFDSVFVLPAKNYSSEIFNYENHKSIMDKVISKVNNFPKNMDITSIQKKCDQVLEQIALTKNQKLTSKRAIATIAHIRNLKAYIISDIKNNKITRDFAGSNDIESVLNEINKLLGIEDTFVLPASYDTTQNNEFNTEEANNELDSYLERIAKIKELKRNNKMIALLAHAQQNIEKANNKSDDSEEAKTVKTILRELSKEVEIAEVPDGEVINTRKVINILENINKALEICDPRIPNSYIYQPILELIVAIERAKKRAKIHVEYERLQSDARTFAEKFIRSLELINLKHSLMDAVNKLIEETENLLEELGIESMFKKIKNTIDRITKAAKNTMDGINKTINAIPELISKIKDKIIDIFDWLNDKISYVIGFFQSSWLSLFFKIFGLNFETIIGFTLNALFGDKGIKTFLTPMESFFNYKTVNGKKIWYNSSASSWAPGQVKIHRTGPIASEIKVWQNLYNADYHEVKDALTLIKQEVNLDVGNTKDDNIYTKFNRFRVPIPDHELNGSMGHIFFVRPDLNLAGGRKRSRNPKETVEFGYAHYYRLFKNIIDANPTLAKHLMKDGFSDHNFMPVLTHACTGIDVADEVLETVETGETFVGWKYVYGTSMIKSKTAGTINITFADDNILSIYKLMKVWTEYISAVRHGEIFPKDEYVMNHQLDYPTSIYYILTDNTGEAILFWTKYTGAFPISTPSSNFSDSLGNRIARPNYSIQFAYSRKDDFNPLHLEEFNRQSKAGTWQSNCIYNSDTMRSIRSFTGAPFIDTTDRELTYRLRFRPPSQ